MIRGTFVYTPTAGGYIRMEITEAGTVKYCPGSPAAVLAGCTCDPVKNNHGALSRGESGNVSMVIKESCPLHLKVNRIPDDG